MDSFEKRVAALKVMALMSLKPIYHERITECVAAIIVDIEEESLGSILYSTPAVNALFGYPDGGLDALNITVIMPERFRSRHPDHLRMFRENSTPRQMGESQMELFGIDKEGNEFKIEISLYPTMIITDRCAVATIIKMRN